MPTSFTSSLVVRILRYPLPRLAIAFGVALALLPALAGCAPNASNDPVVALRIGGTPVSLSSYQQILALFTASDALQTDTSAPAIGWQSPSDRATVNSAKEQTVSFFVNTLTLKTELDKQHLVVTEKDIDVAIAALNAQVANANAQLKQTPGNARLHQLVNAATPDAIRWLAEQQAYSTVFAQKGQLPTVKTQGILVKTQAEAEAIVKQLQGGADFAALAKAQSLDTQSAAKGGDLGTVYVGQFVTAFDTMAFDTHRSERFIIVPFQGSYGVFEILSRGQAPLSAVPDAQTQQQYLNAWIDNVVAPHVAVERYVSK
jgi:hypothetical protein